MDARAANLNVNNAVNFQCCRARIVIAFYSVETWQSLVSAYERTDTVAFGSVEKLVGTYDVIPTKCQ